MNVQSSKQQVVFSKTVQTSIKEKLHLSKGIYVISYERYVYFSLFFHTFCLSSSSCFCPTWFRFCQDLASTAFHPSPLMPGSCFILCFSPRVLIPKALQSRNSMLFYWMSDVQVFRALGHLIFFFKTLFATFPFFSPSPPLMLPTCYSTTLEACCTLHLTKKRGEDWVLAIFLIAFLYVY